MEAGIIPGAMAVLIPAAPILIIVAVTTGIAELTILTAGINADNYWFLSNVLLF